MLTIHDRVEKKRLDGYRVPGELYLVGRLPKFQCCNIPFPLSVDLVPKAGLQPIPTSLKDFECKNERDVNCPMAGCQQFAGMFWIPEVHYHGAAFFFAEARTLPIQIRIKRLHCGVKIGSWVMLAHRKSIVDYSNGANAWVDRDGNAHTDITYLPGIFTMFQVTAIEYIMPKLDITNTPIYDLQKAGVTLVNVIRDEDLEKGEYQEDKIQGYE